ncbi:hypothetical protein J6590_030924 [Homalodisca vitripennis]|nr:hypothetical protein J6590_030924 [Homalodisca vitripennis]
MTSPRVARNEPNLEKRSSSGSFGKFAILVLAGKSHISGGVSLGPPGPTDLQLRSKMAPCPRNRGPIIIRLPCPAHIASFDIIIGFAKKSYLNSVEKCGILYP